MPSPDRPARGTPPPRCPHRLPRRPRPTRGARADARPSGRSSPGPPPRRGPWVACGGPEPEVCAVAGEHAVHHQRVDVQVQVQVHRPAEALDDGDRPATPVRHSSDSTRGPCTRTAPGGRGHNPRTGSERGRRPGSRTGGTRGSPGQAGGPTPRPPERLRVGILHAAAAPASAALVIARPKCDPGRARRDPGPSRRGPRISAEGGGMEAVTPRACPLLRPAGPW
jgi:hypothetical protein